MNQHHTILIVDDDPESAASLRFLLEKNGFYTEVATTAAETTLYLETGFPDLIVMDVVLPDIPGTELCKALKQNKRLAAIPVILISGLRMTPETRASSLSAGAADFLPKPISMELLLAAVRSALVSSQAEDDRLASDREMNTFSQYSRQEAPETAVIFDSAPLKVQFPEAHQHFVQDYIQLIDQAVDERFFKTDGSLKDKTSRLAEKLSFMKSGARDVIEIHRLAVHTRIQNVNAKERRIVMEEGRFLLISLMGILINLYRRKSY